MYVCYREGVPSPPLKKKKRTELIVLSFANLSPDVASQ